MSITYINREALTAAGARPLTGDAEAGSIHLAGRTDTEAGWRPLAPSTGKHWHKFSTGWQRWVGGVRRVAVVSIVLCGIGSLGGF